LTFERQGIERDPHEGFLVRSIARAALDQGFGEIVACKYPAGSIVSSLLLLHDKRSAYALVMGNDPDDRKNGSGIYVFLENIRRYQAKGFSTFDFLGINSPNRGDFKTSLNATPTPYFVVTWERPA